MQLEFFFEKSISYSDKLINELPLYNAGCHLKKKKGGCSPYKELQDFQSII